MSIFNGKTKEGKKPFNETKFGQFLGKAVNIVPDIIEVGAIAATGNITGAIETARGMLKEKAKNDAEVNKLLLEFEKNCMDFEREMYEIEIRDRESARIREVELAKTGRIDWLMYATGVTGLAAFMLIVYAVIWIDNVQNNKLFVHLMGMIEGVAISNLFAYYFGTSKSSHEKDEYLKQKK